MALFADGTHAGVEDAETDYRYETADHRCGKGHNHRVVRNAFYAGAVVHHANLREDQSDALADAGNQTIDDALDGHFDLQTFAIFFLGEDGDGDAADGDEHTYPGERTHLLAQQHPSCQGGSNRSCGHEEFTPTGTYQDEALQEEEVTDDVAGQRRKREIPPSRSVGVAGEGRTGYGP